jgi:hypothetical protein
LRCFEGLIAALVKLPLQLRIECPRRLMFRMPGLLEFDECLLFRGALSLPLGPCDIEAARVMPHRLQLALQPHFLLTYRVLPLFQRLLAEFQGLMRRAQTLKFGVLLGETLGLPSQLDLALVQLRLLLAQPQSCRAPIAFALS